MLLDILVPVLGREHQVEPLLNSIADATDVEHRVTFLCSPADSATEACKASGQRTIVVAWEPGRADFARKINYAYSQSDADWFFQGATDLVFHKDWARHAFYMTKGGFGVIGTNDLGNPLVQRGQHSTHILFSREYIERFNGTFDDTGVVFSTEYDHQFVDTEFVQTAIMRGQFKACLRSHVEHMHPHWRKGEMDSTYAKSERSFREDATLYQSRMRSARYALVGTRTGRAPRRRGAR